MKMKTVSGIMLTLLLMSMLLGAFETIEIARAEPSSSVTFDLTYYCPDGYVHGLPPGEIVAVDVYVDASALTNNSPEGMRGWGLYVIFDPNVLEPFYYDGNPAYVYTSAAGYFLYEWSKTNWPPPPFPPGAPIPYPPTFLKANGTDCIQCAENFLGLPPDMGAGGTGKLCTLYFLSKSKTAYSPITIVTEDLKSGYQDATGAKFPITAIDGHYNVPELPATIDVDSETLNIRSEGQWITAYIELPEGYNPEDIDATTVLLNDTIQPVLDPIYEFVTNSSEYLVDYNEDGILERMVKFDKAEVIGLLCVGENTLTITGEVNGTSFEGSDSIRVVLPPVGCGGFRHSKR